MLEQSKETAGEIAMVATTTAQAMGVRNTVHLRSRIDHLYTWIQSIPLLKIKVHWSKTTN